MKAENMASRNINNQHLGGGVIYSKMTIGGVSRNVAAWRAA
jgi:hypothetical protein